MKIDLDFLCNRIEATVPTAKATALPDVNQVIVSFSSRPDIEIALLTPYYLTRVQKR